MKRKQTGHREFLSRRRRQQKPRDLRMEPLERREVFAAITGNTAPGGFESLNSSALTYWLDPTTNVTSDVNSFVSAWANRGTASRTFTQATAVKQPLLQTGAQGINNRPAIRFDGDLTGNSGGVAPNADELILGSSASVASVFIVNQTLAPSADLAGIWGQNDGDAGLRRSGTGAWQHPGNSATFSNFGGLYVNGATGTNPSAPLGSSVVLSAVRPISSTYSATSLGDYFRVGSNTPRSWAGLMGDVLAFNRVLTDTERIIVENSLASKYGLSTAVDIYGGDATGYSQNVFGIGSQMTIDPTVNHALGRPATQSTNYDPNLYLAGNAVNGVTSDFTHTSDLDRNAFWQVDLQSDRAVDQVLLYNRPANQNRFRDITVQVLDANQNVVYTSPTLNPGNTLGSPPNLSVNPGVTGRFVRVLRTPFGSPPGNADSNVLSLAEVQVFSASTANPSAGSSGFGIEASTSALTTGEYVTAGHKLTTNAIVNTDLPVGVSRRWDRVWNVDKTGTVDATLAFDFTDAGLTAPSPNITSYVLLRSTNTNFETSESAFTVVSGVTPIINGDTISFSLTDAQLQDGYYTLGIATPSVVYVDDLWAGYAAETPIANADSGTAAVEAATFGYDAFSSVTAAIAAVGTNGTVIVNAGTYVEGTVPSLNNGKTLRLTGSNDGAATSTVIISSLDSAAGTTVDLQNNSLQIGDNTGNNNLAGALAGSGVLVKLGTDLLQVSNANTTFTGTTNVNGGQLRMNHAQALGPAASNTITINNGANVLLWFNASTLPASTNTVNNNWVLTGIATTPDGGGIKPAIYGDGGGGGYGTYVLAGQINLNATSNIGGNSANNIQVDGRITGPGGLVKGGFRNDEESNLTLTNTLNDYQLGTSVTKGTLTLGNSNVIPNTSIVQVDFGKTLALGTFTETIHGLSGEGAVTSAAGSTGTLTLDNSTASTPAYVGVISGGVALTKQGTGLQYLGGASTYSGNTTIAAGTLKLVSGTAIPDGAGKGSVTVTGTLDLGEFSETINSITGAGTVTSTPANVQLTQKFFTIDAESGIGPGKVYTHFQDFTADNSGARVNSLTFNANGTAGATTVTGPNWTLTSSPNVTGFAENQAGGAAIPTTLEPAGMQKFYRDFYFISLPGGTTGTHTLTLTGLEVGKKYETRLYNRNFGGPRVQNLTFTNGSSVTTLNNFNQDGSTTANYLPFSFTANATSLSISIASQANSSFHLYGFTNEEAKTPTLTVGDTNSTTFNGSITSATSVVKQGTGTLTLSGTNSYTGSLTVNGGILRPTLAGAIPTDVTVNAGGTFDTNGISFSSRAFTIAGNGASGQLGAIVNTAGGEGSVGNIFLSGNAQIGTSAGKLNSFGTTIDGNGFTLTIAGSGETNIRQNNALQDFGAIVVNTTGGGRLRLESSQAPTTPFVITVNGGARVDTYDARTNGPNLGLALNGGTLEANGPGGALESQIARWEGPVQVTGSSSIVANKRIDLAGAVSGTGTITKTGPDVLNFRGGVTSLGGLNINQARVRFENGGFGSWTGPITVNNTGILSGYGNQSTAADITLNGGTLSVENGGTVTYSGNVNVTATSTLDNNTGNLVLSGGLSGSGALNKVGGNRTTLSGTGTGYTGTLTVGGGTLELLTTLGGNVIISSGATLIGSGGMNGSLTVNGGAGVSPGQTAGAYGAFNIGAGLVLAGLFTADANTPAQVDLLNVSGSVNLTGASLAQTIVGLSNPPGSALVLVQNDGVDPVVGTFSGFAEGTVITVGGDLYRVSYVYNAETNTIGGGNDVALVRNRGFIANDDAFTVLVNTELNGSVVGNDTDFDGDGEYSLATGPANGSVVVNPDGTFTYTPDLDYLGPDSFTYTLVDDEADLAVTATVTINVTNMFVDNTGTLRVNGLGTNDRVVVSLASGGRINVRYNAQSAFFTGVTNKIVAFGQGGDDTLMVSGSVPYAVEFYGGDGNDYLAGGLLDDVLDGGDGSDRLFGNAGNDRMFGGGGADAMSGGLGNDLLDGDRSHEISASNQVGALVLPDIELQGRDTVNGDQGVDVLFGWGGNDSLSGGSENDLAIGGAGLDIVNGGAGTNVMHGSDLNTTDEATLALLAQDWFNGNISTVVDRISNTLKQNDFTEDRLYGETGIDYYLLYALDLIARPAEKNAPNEFRNL